MMKLLKYELKQTWEMGIKLIGITLLACIALLCSPFDTNSNAFLWYKILCGLMIGGSSVYLFFYSMASFNGEFSQPQGYLTMTLPIKTRDLIWAKFINQGIWNGLSALIRVGTWVLIIKRQLDLQFMEQSMCLSILGHLTLNGVLSYILNVFIIYFSIALFSRQPSDNRYNFIKIITWIILSYGVHIIVGLTTSLNHIERLSYHVERYATVTLITGVFYFATEILIDKKMQL